MTTSLEAISEIINLYGHGFRFRRENQSLWEETLLKVPYIPFSYLYSRLDYQLASIQAQGGECSDISLILFNDLQPCGVWPLSYSIKDDKPSISTYGGPVLPPLFTQELSVKSQKKITKACLAIMNQICRQTGLSAWDSAESFSGNNQHGLSQWHEQSMQSGASARIKHELFIDMSLDITSIRTHFRKSYKPLISSGMKMWKVDLMDRRDDGVWDEFRQLHLSVSGRATRAPITWELQHAEIEAGKAFLVYLRDTAGKMVGGGFFCMTRDEGIYAVAAYDRDLFDKPLGHVIQFRAIEELKARGVRWYKIGYRPYASDSPTPSDKEISIGEFKQGFASHIFPQYHLTHPISKQQEHVSISQ